MPARFMCGCKQWSNDINESNLNIQLKLICQMAAPNYPRNGNQQTNGDDDLPLGLFGPRFAKLFLIKLIKWTVKLVLKCV